jgi:hypothetical protein
MLGGEMPVDPRSSRSALVWQMTAYSVLALLAGLTLSDWRIRGAVWFVMGALAVKTWIRHKRDRMPE